MSCSYHNSGLDLWASQFAHHLSTGGTLKCDGCRAGVWWTGNDAPAYVCKICNKGFGECCGESHYCPDPNACSKNTCDYHDSGMNLWASQFAHHLSTGGTLKCDNCRAGTWWTGHDAPAYVCRRCGKGYCTSCGPINH